MHWTGRVSSVAFRLGDFTVAWYGIIITCAMVLALLISIRRVKRINVASEDMLILFIFAIPLAIIFARIGSVVANYEDYFVSPYNWDAFVNTINIRQGGLTIMWGVPGGALGGIIWAKVYKKDFIKVADIVLPTVLLAQALGRWGNFLNQELYGQPITEAAKQWFPNGVFIAAENGWFQATFFYEFAANIAGFILLSYLVRRLDVKLFGTLAYASWYCLVRGCLEFIRNETSTIDSKTSVNTVLIFCFVAAAVCLALMTLLIIRKQKRGERLWYKKGIPPLPVTDKKAKNAA